MRWWDPAPFFLLQIEPLGFKGEKNDVGTIGNVRLIKFLNGTRTCIHLNLYVIKQFSVQADGSS